MKGPSNGTEAVVATADVPATKTETKTKQTPAELLENPYSKLELAVNKKLRNLEKRSQKLVLIKKDQDAGKELTEEQKEAVSKLGEVEIQLEFVRDLQKTITQQTRQYSRAVRQREEGEKKKVYYMFWSVNKKFFSVFKRKTKH
jgi:Na+/phosphate symporter